MSEPLFPDAPLSGIDEAGLSPSYRFQGFSSDHPRAGGPGCQTPVRSWSGADAPSPHAHPSLIAVAVLVAIDGGPIFFRHRRVGRNGETFSCLKFRTMIIGAEECLDEYLSYHPDAQIEWAKEQKLSFDPRVTSVGRFLRLSSIDELPQLINVIKGHMSLGRVRGPSRSRNWFITGSPPHCTKVSVRESRGFGR